MLKKNIEEHKEDKHKNTWLPGTAIAMCSAIPLAFRYSFKSSVFIVAVRFRSLSSGERGSALILTFPLSSFLDEGDLLVLTLPRASLGSLAACLGEAGTNFFGSFFAALSLAGSTASYAGGGIKVGDKFAVTLGEGDLETTLS